MFNIARLWLGGAGRRNLTPGYPIQKGNIMKQISRIPSAKFLFMGALRIFFPSHVASVLPFLLGGIMLLAGIVHGAAYLRPAGSIGRPARAANRDTWTAPGT